jgi:membrane protein YqaA with SNARE-associated domain
MDAFIDWLFQVASLPKVGLPAIFMVSLASATLLPLGSEPVVFGYIKLNPHMYWAAILVATAGNAAGGAIDWWLGYAAKLALVRFHKRRRERQHEQEHQQHRPHPRKPRKPPLDAKYFRWMRRIGPPTLLLSWLPLIGDPLCTLAGWLRLSFWPSMAYMAIGKFLRYLAMTAILMWVPDSFWQGIWGWLRAVF